MKGAIALAEVHRAAHVRVSKLVDPVFVVAKNHWSCNLSKRGNERVLGQPAV